MCISFTVQVPYRFCAKWRGGGGGGGKNSLIHIDNNSKQNNVQQIVTHKSSLADLTQTLKGWGWGVQEKLFVAIDHYNVL